MRLPRLTWGGLDLGDHLVVGDRRLADEIARILRVQDRRVDVVAGAGLTSSRAAQLAGLPGDRPAASRVRR